VDAERIRSLTAADMTATGRPGSRVTTYPESGHTDEAILCGEADGRDCADCFREWKSQGQTEQSEDWDQIGMFVPWMVEKGLIPLSGDVCYNKPTISGHAFQCQTTTSRFSKSAMENPRRTLVHLLWRFYRLSQKRPAPMLIPHHRTALVVMLSCLAHHECDFADEKSKTSFMLMDSSAWRLPSLLRPPPDRKALILLHKHTDKTILASRMHRFHT